MSSSFASMVKKYRNVIILALGTLAVTLGLGMISQALTAYLLSIFGSFLTALGYDNPLVIIIYFIVILIVTPIFWPVMGWLSDRFGRKKIIVPAFFVYSLVAFLYPNMVVFPLVLFYSITGVLSTMTGPASNALIADSVKTNRRGVAFGATAAVYSLVSFVVPAIANAVFYGWNFSGVFYSSAVIIFSGAVLCLLFLIEPTQARAVQENDRIDADSRKGNASTKNLEQASNEKEAKNATPTVGLAKGSRRIVIVSLVIISFLLPYLLIPMEMLLSFVVIDYLMEGLAFFAFVQLWLGLLGVFSLVLAGVLADHLGRKKTLLVVLETSIMLSLVVSISFLVGQYSWSFIALMSIVTFVSGTLPPVVSTMVADITPSRRRGLTYGLVTLGVMVGQSVLIILNAILLPVILFGLNEIPVIFGLTLAFTITATILVSIGVVEPEEAY